MRTEEVNSGQRTADSEGSRARSALNSGPQPPAPSESSAYSPQPTASHARRFALLLCALLVSLCHTALADYEIGEGDLLQISVFGSPELSSEVRVSASGSITFPLLGQVQVGGRSPAQVESMLVAGLVEGAFLRQPQVTVLVTEYLSQQVSVLGHVSKPGQYPLQSENRLMDVIAAAGGLMHKEASDHATLMREGGQKIDIDLAALFSGDPAHNPVIEGGDSIYVPRAPQFYVYGEVQQPGQYKLERHMTVSRAITAGGGLTTRGSERRVVVKRRTAGGKEEVFSVRGSDQLQADDVLLVKEGFF